MRILVIEDDLDIVELLEDGFRGSCFSIEACTDTETAENKIANCEYDAVILDLSFGRENLKGLELLKKIRQSGNIYPILIVTAHDALMHRVMGFAEGADDYIIKPFHTPEIIARLNSILRRISHQQSLVRELANGPIALDIFRQTVRLNDKPVNLNRKEFQLLKIFMDRPDEVIQRKELIRKIWNKEATLSSNTLDVHIRRLRNKFGKYEGLIETLRGVGYRMKKI